MKKMTHAWLALKAVQLLRAQRDHITDEHRIYLDRFLTFISAYPQTFVRGAWFPDEVIEDNIRKGAHTWKYKRDDAHGRVVKNRPPEFLPGHQHLPDALEVNDDKLKRPVSLVKRYSSLADRCEALGYTIRDMILITNKVQAGDVIAFNNSQIALFLLMLAHYIADAHVPVHCDARKVASSNKRKGYHMHDGMEALWEREVEEMYAIRHVDKKPAQFVLDEHQQPERSASDEAWDSSVLKRCEDLLAGVRFSDDGASKRSIWTSFLGRKNDNFWDYTVAVCRRSMEISLALFPLDDDQYKGRKLHQMAAERQRVIDTSPVILADAVVSIAVLWLAVWERYEWQCKIAETD